MNKATFHYFSTYLRSGVPNGYAIEITSIVPHGEGHVVAFTQTNPKGDTEYRVAGFISVGRELRPCFNMVIS